MDWSEISLLLTHIILLACLIQVVRNLYRWLRPEKEKSFKIFLKSGRVITTRDLAEAFKDITLKYPEEKDVYVSCEGLEQYAWRIDVEEFLNWVKDK